MLGLKIEAGGFWLNFSIGFGLHWYPAKQFVNSYFYIVSDIIHYIFVFYPGENALKLGCIAFVLHNLALVHDIYQLALDIIIYGCLIKLGFN